MVEIVRDVRETSALRENTIPHGARGTGHGESTGDLSQRVV